MPPRARHFCRLWAGLCLLLTPFSVSRADLVTEWNTLALTTMRTNTVAPVMARDLAILHTAIFNAGESIRGGYQTYGFGTYSAPGSGTFGASYEAAMISAANTVMQSLYAASGGSFTTLYNTQLSGIADGQAKTDGIAWGASIAADLLAWRAADGASTAGSTPYSPVGTIGYWAQTSGAGALLPGWGTVGTFAIPGTGSYTTSLPGGTLSNYMLTGQYATDYNQVKDIGSSFSLTRTSDQTNQAYFWAAGDGTVKMTGMWNQVAQSAASTASLSVSDKARLFAALNVAMADAGIASFATTYSTEFWRPETAIANGDIDGNASTDVDLAWAPLIASPSFPEYAALSSTLSEAAAATLAHYLGNSMAFSLGSDINGDGSIDMTRNFASFSQASDEAMMSGIYGGTQFGTAAMDGHTMGGNVADWVVNNNFALVPEPAGALLVLLGLATLARRRRGSV